MSLFTCLRSFVFRVIIVRTLFLPKLLAALAWLLTLIPFLVAYNFHRFTVPVLINLTGINTFGFTMSDLDEPSPKHLNLPLLNETNFASLVMRIRSHLRRKGLLEYVENTEFKSLSCQRQSLKGRRAMKQPISSYNIWETLRLTPSSILRTSQNHPLSGKPFLSGMPPSLPTIEATSG